MWLNACRIAQHFAVQNYGHVSYQNTECSYESARAQCRGAGDMIYANPDDQNSYSGGFADIC